MPCSNFHLKLLIWLITRSLLFMDATTALLLSIMCVHWSLETERLPWRVNSPFMLSELIINYHVAFVTVTVISFYVYRPSESLLDLTTTATCNCGSRSTCADRQTRHHPNFHLQQGRSTYRPSHPNLYSPLSLLPSNHPPLTPSQRSERSLAHDHSYLYGEFFCY